MHKDLIPDIKKITTSVNIALEEDIGPGDITGELIDSLDLDGKNTKLLVIVANIKGAEIATNFKQISYVGFPFSISENFQMRNTNKPIEESFTNLICINNIVLASQTKKFNNKKKFFVRHNSGKLCSKNKHGLEVRTRTGDSGTAWCLLWRWTPACIRC